MHGAPSSWPDRGALSAVGTRCPSSLCFHLRAESTSTGTGTSSHGDAAPSRRPEGKVSDPVPPYVRPRMHVSPPWIQCSPRRIRASQRPHTDLAIPDEPSSSPAPPASGAVKAI